MRFFDLAPFRRPRGAAPSYGGLRLPVQRLLAAAGILLALVSPTTLFPAAAQGDPLRVVAFGDSLTAGSGLSQAAAFPAVLEKALRAKGYNVTVANAGVSGDTASGGLARLDWSVPAGTEAVILELGANDMLRGVDPAVTAKALDTIVGRLKERGIAVLLAGMEASPNLGPDYRQRFNAIFPTLAKKHNLVLYPFFLDGVAAIRNLNQPDGLHPTREGVTAIVDAILPTVERFIRPLSRGD